jgi:hypothetical protein
MFGNSMATCERCGDDAQFTAQVSPLGSEPGYRVYYCEPCRHYTWIEWRGSFTQRQQPQPK